MSNEIAETIGGADLLLVLRRALGVVEMHPVGPLVLVEIGDLAPPDHLPRRRTEVIPGDVIGRLYR